MLGFRHQQGLSPRSHSKDWCCPRDTNMVPSQPPPHPHGHASLRMWRAGSQLGPPHHSSAPGSPKAPCASTSHTCSPGTSPLPTICGQAEGLKRESEESRGESLSIPFIPPQSGLHPLPGAKIRQYIQPAAATGHVSPLLGYRDPKINPSQPD